MRATDEPNVIPFRRAAEGPGVASQDLVAVALTHMTRFSLDPADRAASAAAVAEALQGLSAQPELSPELRRLCGRLQALWAATQRAQEGP